MLAKVLDLYEMDICRAHEIYLETIEAKVYGPDGIVKLSDKEIEELQKTARARKSQFFGVATKRLKRAIVVPHLDKLSGKIDLTPALAVRVAKSLIGRAVDRKMLMNRYSTPGREADDKSIWFEESNFVKILEMDDYRDCLAMLNNAYEQMEDIKCVVGDSNVVKLIYRKVGQIFETSKRIGI